MSGHLPKEINAFLRKLDFKVTFILVNKMLIQSFFILKGCRNKYIILVLFNVSHVAAKVISTGI